MGVELSKWLLQCTTNVAPARVVLTHACFVHVHSLPAVVLVCLPCMHAAFRAYCHSAQSSSCLTTLRACLRACLPAAVQEGAH